MPEEGPGCAAISFFGQFCELASALCNGFVVVYLFFFITTSPYSGMFYINWHNEMLILILNARCQKNEIGKDKTLDHQIPVALVILLVLFFVASVFIPLIMGKYGKSDDTWYYYFFSHIL